MTNPEILIFENFIEDWRGPIKEHLLGLPWLDARATRKELFMADKPLVYAYDQGYEYSTIPYTSIVKGIESKLNSTFGTEYDGCFLNHYVDQTKAIGWHSDNHPSMDLEHPIAVISFGSTRELWCRPIGLKGEIPENLRYSMPSGSLLIMPSGYQMTHEHKVPKGPKPLGWRISLTFRHFL